MTDRNKIELPSEWLTVPAIQAWADARARDAVIAALDLHDERIAELKDELARCRKELAIRRAEQAKPAKPEVHSVTMKLQRDGCAWRITETSSWIPSTVAATATLCWTNDGRAWIESEENRELAASLRRGWDFSVAADALDGGTQ